MSELTQQLSNAQAQKLRFEIEDTGSGIPPEQLARIFRPFEQVNDQQHYTAGSGLGLALIGDIMGIRAQLDKIEALDPQFHGFVAKVRPLARALQVSEIQRFLQPYRVTSKTAGSAG